MSKARVLLPQTSEQHLKEMEKHLRSLAHRHSLFTVFQDFVALSAISLSNAVDPLYYAEREETYMKIVQRYTKEEMQRFPEIFSHLVLALEDDPQDHLGRLYHRLELQNEQRGQFFTPWNVCYCMARMTVHDAKHLLDTQPFITAQEPAAGSGTMVMALAQALRDQDINSQQCLHVTAIDIDPLCVHMTYIQLTLLHIPALVIHGDTLRMESWSVWRTAAHVIGFWDAKLVRPTRRPDLPTPVATLPASAALPLLAEEAPGVAFRDVKDQLLALVAQPTSAQAPASSASASLPLTVGTQLTLW